MEHAFVAAIRAYYSNGVDFIEPLDVSTIFGNGLKITACRIAETQRAVPQRMMIFFTVSVFLICEKPLRNMMVS